MKIDFIGIGAQKCASTWVHRILSDHPEVVVYPGKEIDFFSTWYDHGYQWYERQLGDVGPIKARGEVSTSYFADSDTPVRVFLYNPNMRIVLSLRDPIERAYSNHLHEVRLSHFTGRNLDFEDGLANNPMYLEQSRYAEQLARWLAVFPLSQVLVLFQENIRDTPLIQARSLYRFLGLAEGHQSWFLEKKVNESRSIKSVYVDHFLKQAGRLGRSIGVGGVVEAVRKNNWVRRLRRHNQIDLRQVIPPMRKDTRMHLQDVLADDMRELAQQLGREDLPWPSWRALNRKVK
ncbi:MAG: sulfotransferase [Nitrosomonas sp.]|nr:sulfotransferase [Nitrosomonas sp.]MDP1949774.1 sulfotransferase [Nitrosomonas sp.]